MKNKKNIVVILFIGILLLIVGCTGSDETLVASTNQQSIEDANKAHENIVEKDQAEEEIISTINLLATGDIMFHSPQFKYAYDSNTGTYDFSPVFNHVKKYIDEADISIANFETVTAGSGISYSGFPRFNTPKEAVLGIKNAGFDILSTANNHSLDQGKIGLINTIKVIEEYGMKNIGTYIEKEIPILIEDIDGIKLAFLSYTYGLNGMDSTLSTEELAYMINRIDEEKIKNDIEKSKSLNVDLTVIYIHWGNEYQREPSEYQIELGEKMVNWGADIIFGSHPHVIQKSEILNVDGEDKFIIYSMGNFLSNQRKETMGNSYTEDGIILNLEIEKSSLTNKTKISKIRYIPTWLHRYRKDGKLIYEILPIEDVLEDVVDIKIGQQVKERMKRSSGDTMSKMVEYLNESK